MIAFGRTPKIVESVGEVKGAVILKVLRADNILIRERLSIKIDQYGLLDDVESIANLKT